METDQESSSFSIEVAEQRHLMNLSFSGGGFRGLAFLGCVKALQEKELVHSVKSFAGTSVGAIIATLLVAGADYNYLKEVSLGACNFFSNYKLDFLSMIKRGSVNQLRSTFGVYKTDDLREYIKKCLQNVLQIDYDITFDELYSRNQVDLIITASCLETSTPFYFSHKTTKDTPVSEAVAISCSIPFLFNKNIYDNKTLVDGCLIEKLPMQCWPQEEIDYTMAFLLKSSRPNSTDTLSEYINALQSSISLSIDDSYMMRYRNAITVINSGNIMGHGVMPSTEEINKVIYAAYFQTLSELSRRNFIDECTIHQAHEISSLIVTDDHSKKKEYEYAIIEILIIILLVVIILKVIIT